MKDIRSAPRLVASILSIFLILLFFLPLITATEDGELYFDVVVGQDELHEMGMNSDTVKNMSLYSYMMLLVNNPEELRDEEHIGAIIYGSAGVFSLFVLLCATSAHPILMLLFTALTGLVFYSTDSVAPGHMNTFYKWGFAHYVYWPTIALLGICAIWMFVCKRIWKNRRRLRSSASA